MKRKQLSPSRRVATLAMILGLCAWGIHAQATVLFEDAFTNNDNGWSNIGAGTGQATIGIDPGGVTGASVWYASNDDNAVVESSVTLSSTVNISRGAIELFMSVRGDRNDGAGNNRFIISLKETGSGSRFASLTVRPGHTAYMQGLNSSGGTVTTVLNGWSYSDFVNFVDFRLSMTDNGDGSMWVEAFKKESTDGDFVSMGSSMNVDFSSGAFDDLKIYSRNATGNNLAYFDSVSVGGTPPPEPAPVIFEDAFTNNDNGWSNIGTGTGQATIGIDSVTGASVWYASNDDNAVVESSLILPHTADISLGAIELFMRIRGDRNDGAGNNRFLISLQETDSGGRFAALTVRPGHTPYMQGLDSSGATVTMVLNSWSYPDFVNFVDFRLTLTDNGDSSMLVEAFKKESTDIAFVSMGSSMTVDFSSGVFDDLKIYSRNATGDNLAYFDSVSVGGISPVEPANLLISGDGTTFEIASQDLSPTASNVLQTTEDLLPPEWNDIGSYSTGTESNTWVIACTNRTGYFRVLSY